MRKNNSRLFFFSFNTLNDFRFYNPIVTKKNQFLLLFKQMQHVLFTCEKLNMIFFYYKGLYPLMKVIIKTFTFHLLLKMNFKLKYKAFSLNAMVL